MVNAKKADMPTDWCWLLHISVQFTFLTKSHKQSFGVNKRDPNSAAVQTFLRQDFS